MARRQFCGEPDGGAADGNSAGARAEATRVNVDHVGPALCETEPECDREVLGNPVHVFVADLSMAISNFLIPLFDVTGRSRRSPHRCTQEPGADRDRQASEGSSRGDVFHPGVDGLRVSAIRIVYAKRYPDLSTVMPANTYHGEVHHRARRQDECTN